MPPTTSHPELVESNNDPPGDPTMDIRRDDLTGPEIRALLEAHMRTMRSISPPESVHALDLSGLRRPEITFWSAWSGGELLGCGALKELGPRHGEVKSMHTAAAHRHEGVGRAILRFIEEEAKRRGYRRLSLETGSQAAFDPAHRLYESSGFRYCSPFADYRPDPNSVFMTKVLASPCSRKAVRPAASPAPPLPDPTPE